MRITLQQQDGYTSDKLKRNASALPRREFVALWVLLVTLHTVCAAYLVAMARLYFFMEHPLMRYLADMLALPEQRHFHCFGVVVGILGGLHAVQLLLHIALSIQAKTLVVWPRAAMVKKVVKFLKEFLKISERKAAASSVRVGSLATRLFVGLKSVLSIEGIYFEAGFVLQKVVEVFAQINQCSHYSTLISRAWINQAFVGIVVANCVLTALFNHLMLAATSRARARVGSTGKKTESSSIRERTLCVAMDVLLSTMSCLVLPLAIFMHWALQFDTFLLTFPTEVFYDDTAFPRLVYENQAIFAISITDIIAKLVPHASVLLSLASLSSILETYAPPSTKHAQVVVHSGSSARQESQSKPPLQPAKPSAGVAILQHFVTLPPSSQPLRLC